MSQTPPVRQGLQIPQPPPGKIFQWLAKGVDLRTLIAVANAFSNGKILVNITMPGGAVQSVRGQLIMSDVNSELQIPVDLSQLPSTGSSGASRVFAGAGPPTSATLTAAAAAMGVAATFINALNPDLYVDTSGQAMWFCSAAGSDSTSVWSKILTGGGGVTQYNWGVYPAGSVVQFDPFINNPGISTSGDVNLPGFYVTLNGIGAADNSIPPNMLSTTVGAHNVPGWPKQNDWDFISFKQILKMAVCKQNSDGSVSSYNYWFNAYGPVT